MDHRTERDSIGELQVPADAYYGVQTARAVENFRISGLRAPDDLVSATILIKKAAGLKATGKPGSGSKEPGRNFVGTITMTQIREIAEKKMKDMNATDVEAAARTIAGSARSMGLQVVES